MNRYALLIAALFASPAFGQPSSLSLRQALDYAQQHQPSLIAARARVQAARAQALVPEAAKAFRVGAAAEILGGTNNNTTASYATLGFLDVARVGGTPANAPVSWTPYASTLAGISVHKELYDFGRIDLLSDAFGAQAQAANEAAQVSALDLDLFVEESFYAVLGAKAVLAASQAAVTRSTTHRDFARARVSAQLMPPIELARAEADLARYQVDQVRAQGSLATAQAVLAAAIGSSAPAVDAGTDDVALKEPGREALGDVESHSPELRAARDQLDAQRLFTRSIKAEMRPDLGISAELTGRAGGATVATNPSPAGAGFVPDVPNWDALVVFTWPLYDKVVSARADTSAQLEAVRAAELQQVSEQVRSEAEQTFIELDVERAAQPALQRAVEAAAANHEQAEARFNGGLGTAVELSDAEALLTEAQIQLAVGQFQLSRARARLARVFAESTK
ncbi:MAG TPA: TolC family protein [Kofleriaceae bacterium]